MFHRCKQDGQSTQHESQHRNFYTVGNESVGESDLRVDVSDSIERSDGVGSSPESSVSEQKEDKSPEDGNNRATYGREHRALPSKEFGQIFGQQSRYGFAQKPRPQAQHAK